MSFNSYTENNLVEQPDGWSLDDLSAVLKLSNEVFTLPAERTLFSVGVRGYFENPTSDLLAFFLDPTAEHGLGDLFLASFLECIDSSDFSLQPIESITVEREIPHDGGRMDLVILGSDWCLIIENKIYHRQVNPFDKYENYAETLNRRTKRFAILSPQGTSERENWIGVSYESYLGLVGQRLSASFLKEPFSKWHLFAREFINHIQNELYTPTMTHEQAAFVEKHGKQIEAVTNLVSEYRRFLQAIIRQALEASFPNTVFSTKDQKWAIRCHCYDVWGESNLAFWRRDDGKFSVSAYVYKLSEAKKIEANKILSYMDHWNESDVMVWCSKEGFIVRDDAVRELCHVATLLTSLTSTP